VGGIPDAEATEEFNMDAIERTTGEGARDRTWVRTAGLAIGALTLLYMMAVALLLMFHDIEISSDARSVLIIVLAVGLALAFSFIGGHAAASGTVPLLARHPLKFSAGGGIAVFLIVFFTASVAWTAPTPPPPPTPPETWMERQAMDLKGKIVELRGDFESASCESRTPSPGSGTILARIGDDSERLANEMLRLDESQMRLRHDITRSQYGSYALGLAASLEDSPAQRLALARKTRSAAEHALRLVSQAETQAATGGRPDRRLLRSLADEQAEGRLRYLIALAMAIELRTAGGSVRPVEVLAAMDAIPARFREKSPLEWNKWFRGVKEMATDQP
jgi:hypothetical protein